MSSAFSCYALSWRNIATLPHTTQDVVRSPLTELLLSIVFADRLHGLASGSNGAFLRTTDVGETWISSSLRTSTINAIAFADDRNGMLQTGLSAEMTDDSGAHWSPVTGFETDPSKKDYFEVLSFARLNANRAAIALHQKEGENYFFVTQDAGKT